MRLNRRRFLLSSSSACIGVTALASAGALATLHQRDSIERAALVALAQKLPHLDIDDPVVRRFVAMLALRNESQAGASLTSIAEARDLAHRTVSFERFVCREFLTSTNYLEAGRSSYPGLRLRTPAAMCALTEEAGSSDSMA